MTATKDRKPATERKQNERKPTAATPHPPPRRKLTRDELQQMLADAARRTAAMSKRAP
jgi:hypothetical protein